VGGPTNADVEQAKDIDLNVQQRVEVDVEVQEQELDVDVEADSQVDDNRQEAVESLEDRSEELSVLLASESALHVPGDAVEVSPDATDGIPVSLKFRAFLGAALVTAGVLVHHVCVVVSEAGQVIVGALSVTRRRFQVAVAAVVNGLERVVALADLPVAQRLSKAAKVRTAAGMVWVVELVDRRLGATSSVVGDAVEARAVATGWVCGRAGVTFVGASKAAGDDLTVGGSGHRASRNGRGDRNHQEG